MTQSVVWQPVYVGLGSNVGDSLDYLRLAMERIAIFANTRLIVSSPFYRTKPFGPVPQGPFINAVAAVLTRQGPADFLRLLWTLERELGRTEARVRWGPREIDLDLLVYGDVRLMTTELTLPHPGIPERDFVLYPLRDIAPQLLIPGMGRTADLANWVIDRGIERLDLI
ncbi:MAG: 2-amino-4-hydroxy-6-hydroxymethyldihydropteridine diphosphokinase [Gammaproteobacteria bacterium]|nr:2-amino-4-hydroxy-6-hydroxymethyldihydropteridine diphosphokinase [Gammaproteobacteria bacterium]